MAYPSNGAQWSTGPRQSPRRLGGVIASAALVLVAVVVLLEALSRTTLTYVTPAGPGRAPNQNSVVWTPGVVAAVVASVAALASLGLAVKTWFTRTTGQYWWWATAGLVLLAVVWTIVTSTIQTPKF